MAEPLSAAVEIRNVRGLHARASAKFCAVANSFDAQVRVSHEGWTVRGDSIMGLITMGAGPGSQIIITAEGPQAAEALDALVRLVADRFGERE
uniref:Phosphotransferase system, phosphocarrier protein HPr n=1 Tax=uncultured bacterium UPO57 TaxID=1776980 RepID=A0A126SYK5_9BACT|nr:phosphotransferase system, phosphocarrier protein HPr [uncultured bacterium UPO57]